MKNEQKKNPEIMFRGPGFAMFSGYATISNPSPHFVYIVLWKSVLWALNIQSIVKWLKYQHRHYTSAISGLNDKWLAWNFTLKLNRLFNFSISSLTFKFKYLTVSMASTNGDDIPCNLWSLWQDWCNAFYFSQNVQLGENVICISIVPSALNLR